jgi:hypothetical protein
METEARAADTLLDGLIHIAIPTPWFLRILGWRRIRVWFRRPLYVQCLRISALYTRMGLSPDQLRNTDDLYTLFSDHAKYGVDASRLVAMGLIRGATTTALFHRPLARYMRRYMTDERLGALAALIAYLSTPMGFLNIIASAAIMRVTEPTASRKPTGS